MVQYISGCAILADRHLELAEGIRGLLETTFGTVYVVAGVDSLLEGAKRLDPALIALDMSLADGNITQLLEQIRRAAPQSRLLVLSVFDLAAAPPLVLAAGANGIVLKRTIGSDLLPAIAAVMRGETYVSSGFGLQLKETENTSSPLVPLVSGQ
ncbi:MAG TPA: response regulator [Xanthomonadales bacterium]|nr:response regulator [Xanthomonadales bacterium]